jgi:glycosyltransferase involved in cell wall biosynthesis
MKLVYCLTHPIQYQAPLIRHLRACGVDVEVVYATDITAGAYRDEGFGKSVSWDIPLLEGYPHRVLFSGEPLPSGLGGFRRYRDAIGAVLDDSKPAAVWVHGWGNAYPLAALSAARRRKLPVLMRGETSLDCLHGGRLRRMAHRLVLTMLFRSVSQFLAIGTANQEFYRCHGVPEKRIHLVPYAVDNAFFQARAAEAKPNREKLRAELGVEPGRPIILFCGKLIGVKAPETLIRAVGRVVGAPAKVRDSENRVLANAPTAPVLLMAGDGELRASLEKLAAEAAPGLVKFLGFRNQTELPAFYDLCDVFVLPSVFEPWGLVVNEVMNAAKPVIVSDKVGAGHDLVRAGVNGEVFRAGDVDDLYGKLLPWLHDAEKRVRGGQESQRIINRWGFDENLRGLKEALKVMEGA